jgi:hypothetical protein
MYMLSKGDGRESGFWGWKGALTGGKQRVVTAKKSQKQDLHWGPDGPRLTTLFEKTPVTAGGKKTTVRRDRKQTSDLCQ